MANSLSSLVSNGSGNSTLGGLLQYPGSGNALQSMQQPVNTSSGLNSLSGLNLGTGYQSNSNASNPINFGQLTMGGNQQSSNGLLSQTNLGQSTQLSAFNAANALGSGVNTTGSPQTINPQSNQSLVQPSSSYTGVNTQGQSNGNGAPTVPTSYTTPNGNYSINAGTGATTLTPQGQSVQNQGSTNTSNAANNTPTNQGLISQAQNTASGNLALGQNAQNIANNYAQQIAQVGQQGANAQAGYLTTGTSPVAEGNAAVLAQTTAADESALAQGEQAALQGNSNQLTAQNQATQGLLGVAQQGQNTVTGVGGVPVYTSNGQAVGNGVGGTSTSTDTNSLLGNASTGNSLVDTSVENALQQIQNGASTSDAMANIAGGTVGQNAFIKAMQQYQPGWNITSSNASVAQNMAEAQQAQGAAFTQGTALGQLQAAGTTATNLLQGLQSSGIINPTNIPSMNAGIDTYQSQMNPTQLTAWNAVTNDIEKFQSAILATNTGQIPTETTNMIQSMDPSKLSAKELQPYLTFLGQLGSNQQAVSQQQSTAAYSGGQAPYAGTPTQVNTNTSNVSQAQGANLQRINGTNVGNAAVGGIMGFVSGVEGLASSIFGKVASLF